MKRNFLLLVLVLMPIALFAQEDPNKSLSANKIEVQVTLLPQDSKPETVLPTEYKTVLRRVSELSLEGETYDDVEVVMTSSAIEPYLTAPSVKILVKKDGKQIYKKRLYNAYLYIFSNGQIQVGKPNFSQLLISPKGDGVYIGEIREYEGVY